MCPHYQAVGTRVGFARRVERKKKGAFPSSVMSREGKDDLRRNQACMKGAPRLSKPYGMKVVDKMDVA
jgi:hypothetical protein